MKKSILCVDDENIVLDSLKSQLKRRLGSDFSYETALNAEEAFEIIEDLYNEGVKIVLIVSDWLMPGIKGDEFLVKVHELYPDMINILLTGRAELEAIENAKNNANLFACLEKPWAEDELISIIKKALEEFHE